MAVAVGMISSGGSSWVQSGGLKGVQNKKIGKRGVCCSYSALSAASLTDQYRTLKIQPGASETEVKRAFRQLALQYHPDVCKGSNCGVQFHRINEAYDVVMSNLRGESNTSELYNEGIEVDPDDQMRGMYDPDWDMWEEWIGWEGAGIRDYTSHINPYI